MESESDEWAERQVHTFVTWLNHVFYPNHVKEDGTISRIGLRSIVSHQRLAQGRLAAANLFQSTELSKARKVIFSEIAKNRIAIRPDRDLNANLSCQENITSLLLEYSTPWLRLGLETIFGTVIQPHTALQFSPRRHQVPRHAAPNAIAAAKGPPRSPLKLALKQFIVQHVLSDDRILAKYTGGKCKVPSGKFGERYRAEMRAVILKRLLVLVIFLDRAKVANVLEEAPNLFEHSASIKSTRDVLLSICRDFLQSQGDFVKHLSRIGIPVSYRQEAVDELDFFIANLRADLSNGIRLVRLAEVLTGAVLLPKLRLPAVSRLQKMYNVRLALDHLAAAGVNVAQIFPYHVVDGHREMVLKLLWSVVGQCGLSTLLSVEQVTAEIQRLQRWFSRSHNTVSDDDDDEPSMPLPPTTLEEALLQWAYVVCNRFGHPIVDFSKSWASGRAVCLLIHFYHPTLLHRHEIRGSHRANSSPSLVVHEFDLENDRANVQLANVCMADLGIPGLMPSCDTLQPPHPKSIALCLAFLCSRLVESRLEVRACVYIQRFYRYHHDRVLWALKKAAARIIVAAWQRCKADYYAAQRRRYGAAVATIENFVLATRAALHRARHRRLQDERLQRAALLIQVRLDAFGVRLLHCCVSQCPIGISDTMVVSCW
jgi:abnormal spindle-like microcephaly-associated protein